MSNKTDPFTDEKLNESYWQLQAAIDQVYKMSRVSRRTVLPGYCGTAVRALYAVGQSK